jgi:hypothetical protein
MPIENKKMKKEEDRNGDEGEDEGYKEKVLVQDKKMW